MNPDGSAPTQLTQDWTGRDDSPAWSPDRTHVAFIRTVDPDNADTSSVCVVPASGGVVRSWNAGSVISNPCFSPDGKSIAFVESEVSKPGAKNEWQREMVMVLDLQSGSANRVYELNDLFIFGMSVSWSPDGTRLLLGTSEQDDEGQRTGMLDLRSRKLTWLGMPDANESHWSPDGRSIVVSRMTQGTSSISIATGDGRISEILLRGSGEFTDSSHTVGQASFSPDGSQIVYATAGGIGTMRSDGTETRTILTNAGAPAWSCR